MFPPPFFNCASDILAEKIAFLLQAMIVKLSERLIMITATELERFRLLASSTIGILTQF